MFRVLAVDSDVRHLQHLAQVMHRIRGTATATCLDLASAKRTIEAAPPDLLLIHSEIRGESPMELVCMIAASDSPLPELVLMVDPEVSVHDVSCCLESGTLQRPAPPAALRTTVEEAMGRRHEAGDRRFGRSLDRTFDLLRIALLSADCLRLDVQYEDRHVGTIVVREHGVWSASDPLGSGDEAFCRLLQRPGIATVTRIARHDCGPRTIDAFDVDEQLASAGLPPASAEDPYVAASEVDEEGWLDLCGHSDGLDTIDPHDTFHAATAPRAPATKAAHHHDIERLFQKALAANEEHTDEAQPAAAGPPPAEPVAASAPQPGPPAKAAPQPEPTPTPEPVAKVEPKPEPKPAREAEAASTHAMLTPEQMHRFDRALDRGIDAMLHKRYDEAYDAMQTANAILPEHPRVLANIERLRALGVVRD